MVASVLLCGDHTDNVDAHVAGRHPSGCGENDCTMGKMNGIIRISLQPHALSWGATLRGMMR
jgi:hypothetical protein